MSEKTEVQEEYESPSPSADNDGATEKAFEVETKKRPTTLSRQTTRNSTIDPAREPPDGGLEAWLKVFGCFLLYSNIWGFTLSFGAFQAYYSTDLLASNSPSAISWIGTVQSWLLILVGVLSGPLFDLGYYRIMLFVGNFMVVFGIFMLSLCTEYWQVFLAQGICMGLGAGLLYVPSMAVIGLSFSKKRALAQGIVTAGIAVGGIAYIISFNQLVPTRGFGWAVRVQGFISLAIALISMPALLYGTSAISVARTRRKLYDASAFRDKYFIAFTATMCMTFLGYIVPYFYIPTFAIDALKIDGQFALYILVIATAASFFGRLSSGVIAQALGPIVTWCLCSGISGIIALGWIGVSTQSGLIALSVFWGFCSAALVTLPAAVFPSLCPDPTRLGTRTGMSWGISSFASLIGSPIAGALLKGADATSRTRRDFLGPQLWAGICLILGSLAIFILWTIARPKLNKGWRI